MNLESIAKEALKFSPLIATAIGGPAGGIIASLLSAAFGCTTDTLADTISTSANSAVTMQQFELEHKKELAQIQSTQYTTEVNDRENARDREVEIDKITGQRDWMLDTIAMVVILGFFCLCMLNYFVDISDDHVITMLVGQISSGFVLVLSYYFGSSKK